MRSKMLPIKLNPFQLYCLYVLLLVINCNLINADRRNTIRNNHRGNNHNGDNQDENQFERPSSNHNPNRNVKRGLDEDMKHPLGKDDFERAKNLDQSLFPIDDEILMSDKLFQGDIVDHRSSGIPLPKSVIINPRYHWPDGKVPYVISADFSLEDRAVFARAIEDLHSKTCVRFETYTGSEPNYIHIVRGERCSSEIGMIGGMQQVTLAQRCVTVGTVEHELMHALGFYHEHARTDRDQYVRVNFENIKEGLKHNFEKFSAEKITTLNEPYDYGSVLHYGPDAGSNGNGPTIEPLKDGVTIGQRVSFSEIDLRKINKLYRCEIKRFKSKKRKSISSGKLRIP